MSGFPHALDGLLPLVLGALVVGTLVGVLLSALLWKQVRRRRRAESAAHRARADLLPLAQALQHSTEAVVVTDVRRRLTWANPAFERITGYRVDEVLGRSPGELLQFECTDPQTVLAMRAALDRGEGFVGEVLNRGRDQQVYWLELLIQPLRDARGALTGFVSIQSDITQRKQAEAALRESEALLDNTGRIAGVGGGVFDIATRRLRCTRATARLLELPNGEAVPDYRRLLRSLPRGTRRRLLAMARRSAESGQLQSADVPFSRSSGMDRWMRVSVETDRSAGGGRIAFALVDVTQRVAMKAELQRAAELLRNAFDAVDEGMALFDPDDRLVFCNPRYRELYEVSRDLIVPGQRYEDILRHGAEAGEFAAAVGRVDEWLAQAMATRAAGDRTRVQRLGGGRILRAVDRRMDSGHRIAFRVDITSLVQAGERAEQADRAKSLFIATVSHELRTPLQVINGFSDLGRHFARGHAQYEPMFEDIHGAGKRMLALVNDLLDVSKIDGSLGSLALKRHDLAALADAAVHELRQLAGERGVTFRVAVQVRPLPVDADAFRLQQVLRNLLANALRFAPQGSEVTLAVARTADAVEVSVRDHGPGIPADELETIFEPFVQGSRAGDQASGTGLGLAICRRIVSAHGGRIEADIPADGGALFRVRLPLPQRDEEPRMRRLLRSAARPDARRSSSPLTAEHP